jgi:electron transfer flavoprotein beta subunit
LKDYDFIFGGRQAIDGDTAQVGPQTAEKLGIPQITYVQDIVLNDDNTVTVQRQLEDGYEVIKVKSPAMLTAVKELNSPRYMSVDRIFEAMKMDITRWNIDDLDVSPTDVGLKASPTRVYKSFTPPAKGKSVMLEGSVKDMVEQLAIKFKHHHII